MFKKKEKAAAAAKAADVVEVVACKDGEMKDGEMKMVDLGEGKALLVRDHGKYQAVGPKCTHFGAPLNKGAYSHGRVRCPWHGACFSLETGDIEDFPGLDSIHKFQVVVENGEVKIRAGKEELQNFRRKKDGCKQNKKEKQVFVVVGGGGATASAVETLRQEGFGGRIVMVTGERHLPYDRTMLSKMLDAKPEKVVMRNADVYKSCDVETMPGKQVVSLDVKAKALKFNDGKSLKFDKVLFATGGSPRMLGLPGEDLKNIHLLRCIEDGNQISGSGREKNVVVIGTSFIGLEVAAYMLDKGGAGSVTIVGRSEVPLKQVLGEKVGVVVRALMEKKGAKFVFKNPPKAFEGAGGALKAVVLQDGTKLDADVCVIGAGVSPNTGFLKDSGVDMSPEGQVIVDKHMRTNVPDVYAAGDITKFPLFIAGDAVVNVQHWQMALQQGLVAARNMAGKEQEIRSVPFFWTMLLGKRIVYAGYGAGHDDVIVHGSMEEYKFIAYYTKGDKVVAVATVGGDPVAAQAAEVFYHQIPLSKKDVINDKELTPAWTSKLVQ